LAFCFIDSGRIRKKSENIFGRRGYGLGRQKYMHKTLYKSAREKPCLLGWQTAFNACFGMAAYRSCQRRSQSFSPALYALNYCACISDL